MVRPTGFEWGVVLTGSAVVAMLVAFYALQWSRSVESRRAEPVQAKVKAEPIAGGQPTPAPPPKEPAPARPSTFRFTATRGDTWLQARAGSFHGPVLYEGQLLQGETIRLRSRRLWIRFGGASDLDVFINGRRAWLPAFGTYDAMAGPHGVVTDPTIYATAAQSP